MFCSLEVAAEEVVVLQDTPVVVVELAV